VETNNNQIYDKVIRLIDETKEYYSEKTFPKPERVCLSPDRCSAENCRKVLDNLREDVAELKKHRCPECGRDMTDKINNVLSEKTITINGYSEKELNLYDDSICTNCAHPVSVYVKMVAEVR
jgi:phosphoribosylpyrophosphate synthetase